MFLQENADLVSFTEEILNKKLNFWFNVQAHNLKPL